MNASFVLGILFTLQCLTIVYLVGKVRAHKSDNEMLRTSNTDLSKRADTFRDKLAEAIQREEKWLSQPIQVNLTEQAADRIAAQVAPYLVSRVGKVQ